MFAKHPHRDIRLRRPWRQDCAEDARVPICAGAKPSCRVISLAAFKHSLRIMSIDSLPEACVSLMTFDIIFLSMAPRRSTLPHSQSSRSDRHTIFVLARVEPNAPLFVFLDRSEQASASWPNASSRVRKLVNMHVTTRNRGSRTLAQSVLDHTLFPYKQH